MSSSGADTLYAAFKRSVLQRAALDKSHTAAPPSRPRCEAAGAQSSHSHTAGLRAHSSRQCNPLTARLAHVLSTPVRPHSARPTAAPPKSLRTSLLSRPASASSRGTEPVRSAALCSQVRSLCSLMSEVESLAARGEVTAAMSQLRLLGLAHHPSLCCTLHRLLVARLFLVTEGPQAATGLYKSLDNCEVDGTERNVLRSLLMLDPRRGSTTSITQQLECLTAVIDAMVAAAPFVAAHFLLVKAWALLQCDVRFTEARACVAQASQITPQSCCCKAASCLTMLTDSEAPLCSDMFREALTAYAGSKDVSCSQPFCTSCGPMLRELHKLFSDLSHASSPQYLSSSEAIATLERARDVLSAAHLPDPVMRAMLSAIEADRCDQLLSCGQPLAAKDSLLDIKSSINAKRWAPLFARSLVALRNWSDAFDFVAGACESADLSLPAAAALKLQIASDFCRTVVCGGVSSAATLRMFDTNASDHVIVSCGLCDYVASKAELQRWYRKSCLLWHPDKWSHQKQSASVALFCFRMVADAHLRLKRLVES